MYYLLIIIILCILYLNYYNKKDIEHFNNSDEKQRIYTIMLQKIMKVSNELNIPLFLSSGTCLGYFRERKFIKYDYDIDIGIFSKDYNSKLINKLIDNGFKLYRFLGDIKNGCEFSFYYPGTVLGKKAKLDIFIHYNEGDKIYWNAFKKELTDEKKIIYKKIKYSVSNFDLKKVKFMELNVYVPSPVRKYIVEHYGLDWYKPKRPGIQYKYYLSPVSISK